jgi:hypothetical protein
MNLLHVHLIPQGTNNHIRGELMCTLLHVRLILKATTSQVPQLQRNATQQPIRYRGDPLSTVQRVSPISTSGNRLSSSELQKSDNRSRASQLRQKRYWAFFSISIAFSQATTVLLLISYIGTLLSTLLHERQNHTNRKSLVPFTYRRAL